MDINPVHVTIPVMDIKLVLVMIHVMDINPVLVTILDIYKIYKNNGGKKYVL